MLGVGTDGDQQKKGSRSVGSLQDEATRAWNFHTALYYKAGGIPWRLIRDPSQLSSYFVGVSFFRSLEGDKLLTSVAQVFNERGEGVIVRGGDAQIDKEDRQPHLSIGDAKNLLKNALQTYRREHGTFPARAVIHRTSKMTEKEIEGFDAAALLRMRESTLFDGGEPINVHAARRVGDILKCVPEDEDIQSSFRFFI